MAQTNSKKATLRITNHGMAVLKEEGMKAKGESCLKLFQRNQLFGPFDNGMFVKIMCAHGHFEVHKALVGSKSQLLADLINGAEAKIAGETPVIRLAETDINIAEKLFRCLYQGYTIVTGAQEYNKIEALSRTLGFGEFLSTNPTCDDKVGDCVLNIHTVEEGTGTDHLLSIEGPSLAQTLAISPQEKTKVDASKKLSGSSQFHNVVCQDSGPLVVVTQRRVIRSPKQDGIDRQAIREDIRDTQARSSTTQNPPAMQSTSRARAKSHPKERRPPFGQIVKNSVNEDPTPSTSNSKACGAILVPFPNNTDKGNQSAKRPRPLEPSSSKSLGETTTTDKAPATFPAPNAPGPKKSKVDEVQLFVKTAHVIIPPKVIRKQPPPNTNPVVAEPKQSTSKGSIPDIKQVPEFRKVAREALQAKVPRKNPARQYKPPQRYSDFSDSCARKSPTKTNKSRKDNENHLESSLVASMEEGHALTEGTTKASPRVKKTDNEPSTSVQGASRRPAAQVDKAMAVNNTEKTSKTTTLPRKGALRDTRHILDVPNKCDFCNKVFRGENALIRHMQTCQPHLKVTVSGVTRRQCSFCSSNHKKTSTVGFLRHVARCYCIVNQLSDEDGKTLTFGNQGSRNPEKNESSNLLKASGVDVTVTQRCKNTNLTSSAASRPGVSVSLAKQHTSKGVKQSEPTSDDANNSSSVGSPVSQGEVIPIMKCHVPVASSDVKALLGLYKARETLNGMDDIVVTSAAGKAVRREIQISLPTKSLKHGGKNRNMCKPVATGISSRKKNLQKSKAKKGVAKTIVGRQVIRKRIGPASKIGRKMLTDGKITKVDAPPARVVETPPPILKPETFAKVGPACKTGRRPVPKPDQHPPILIPMTHVIQHGTSNTAASRNGNQENIIPPVSHNTSSKESNHTDLSTTQAKQPKQVVVVSSRETTSLSLKASQTRVSSKSTSSSHEETSQNVVKPSGINLGTGIRGTPDKDNNISSKDHTNQASVTSPNANGLNAGSVTTNDSRSEASTTTSNFKIPENPTKPKPKTFSAQKVVKKMQQVLSKPRVISQTPELSAANLPPSADAREPSTSSKINTTIHSSPENTEIFAVPVCSGQPSNSEDRVKITTDRFGNTTGWSMDWIRENHLERLLDGQTDITASLQPDTWTQTMVEKVTIGNSVQHTKKSQSQLQLQDETELEEIEFSAITPTDLANGILNVREENNAGDELSNEQNEFSQDYEDSSEDEEKEEDMYPYEMVENVDGTSYVCLKCSLNYKELDWLKDHICI